MIRCEWTRTANPVLEPLTLEEAKAHCSISQHDDNALIQGYLRAARDAAEAYLHRALYTQTWTLQMSDWADVIWLPMAAPLQNNALATPSTAPVIQYYDADGTLQTLATSYYVVDTVSEPGVITRAPNQSWPTLQSDRRMRVIVTYVCGWSTVAAIPEAVKQGMRFHIAASDMDRTGGSGDSEAARQAARNVWHSVGQVYWREPETCLA